MKISVLIPSRGRPESLVRSVRALQGMASGNHEIVYAIGADHDDPPTVAACIPLGPTVRVHVLKRRGSLGQIVNILSEQCPADVYCSYADDIEMLEPGWDQHIADAVEEHPDWVMWFKANVKDNFNTYAIVPEKWRKAAGRIFTDYFPFWHDDGWLMQVDLYARGADEWVALEVAVKEMGETAGKTHRLFANDFPFWQQFFWSRDGERLEEAARIAKALGWPADTALLRTIAKPFAQFGWELPQRTDSPLAREEPLISFLPESAGVPFSQTAWPTPLLTRLSVQAGIPVNLLPAHTPPTPEEERRVGKRDMLGDAAYMLAELLRQQEAARPLQRQVFEAVGGIEPEAAIWAPTVGQGELEPEAAPAPSRQTLQVPSIASEEAVGAPELWSHADDVKDAMAALLPLLEELHRKSILPYS